MGNRKERVGTVVSDRMDKTIVLEVSRLQQHPLYRRVIKRQNRLKAHDENNECRNGDQVRVVEVRPISKEKRWKVMEILRKAE